MKGADFILELIFKGLLQWIFDMIINITEYLANSLLTIFTMDLTYFESSVPITGDTVNIIIGVGWALLLGNLVFQATKSMISGLGFEGESPQTLFGRTFVMGFLLVGSRQVCDIGLSITKKIINLLQVPATVQVPKLSDSTFAVPGDASWLLVIIIGIILTIQIVRLFFEIGERYVIVSILTILSPLAFAMGGSKSTSDIFKGWVRMFASMSLMMVLSVVFLKFLLSAMSIVPTGVAVVPWCIFVVAIARTGRKVDGIIARIGLNPAITGDPLGLGRMPGMLSYTVMKNMIGSIGKSAEANKSGGSKTGTPRPAPSSGMSIGGTAPARPPIGSSGGSGTKNGTINPAPVSGGHSTPGTANPTESSAHKDSSHAPIMTPGKDAGETGVKIISGTHGAGVSDKLASRPPIAAPASDDKSSVGKSAALGAHGYSSTVKSAARPTIAAPTPADESSGGKPSIATGSHGAAASYKTTAARPIADSTHRTASTDKPGAATVKPAATSVRGTAATEKIPPTKPVSASPHGSATAEKPVTARPVAAGSAFAKNVSSLNSGNPVHTSESPKASASVIKGYSTDAPKPVKPIAARPTADIKSADTAKSVPGTDTYAKPGVPHDSAVKGGMPLTERIKPGIPSTGRTSGSVTSRGESEKTAKDALPEAVRSTRPTTPTAETGKPAGPVHTVTGMAVTANAPKPGSESSSKSSAESRPSGVSAINKTGDVNQKGGNISQSHTNATNVTLQQKAVTPKRNSPTVSTVRGEHNRPPAGKMPYIQKPSGAGSPGSISPASETQKPDVHTSSETVQNKGVPERAARGSAKDSYRNASSRPENKTVKNNDTAKTSGTAGHYIKNTGTDMAANATGNALVTNTGVAKTTLSQSGISLSKAPPASHGEPSQAGAATRPNTVNNVQARSERSNPAQSKPAQTNINNNTVHLPGKSQKQSYTGVKFENNEKLKSSPPYKPSNEKSDVKK